MTLGSKYIMNSDAWPNDIGKNNIWNLMGVCHCSNNDAGGLGDTLTAP